MPRAASLIAAAGLALLAAGCDGATPAVDAGDDAAAVCTGAPSPLAAPPCGDGEFLYLDTMCGGPPPPGSPPSPCSEVGDGLCHVICATDADCRDPCRPHCRVQGLWSGLGALCNGQVRICAANAENDC